MMCPTLLEHGFVHSAPVRIEGGREEWQVCFVGERTEIRESLDAVQENAGAEVTVQSMSSSGAAGTDPREQRLDTLTTTQREVYEHAREAGGITSGPPGVHPRSGRRSRRVEDDAARTPGRRSRSCLIREARQPESGAVGADTAVSDGERGCCTLVDRLFINRIGVCWRVL